VRTDHAIPGRPHAHGVIIVLEKANLETLVKRADSFVGVPAHPGAEHRRSADIKYLSSVTPHVLSGEPRELAPGAIGDLHLSFVAAAIGGGAGQADRWILQML